MATLCQLVNEDKSCVPRILGLTASPLSCKKGTISNNVLMLEQTTGCTLLSPKDNIVELNKFLPKPKFRILRYMVEDGVGELSSQLIRSASYGRRESTHHINIQTEYTIAMAHAYSRLRLADYVSELLLIAHTLKIKPSDMPELNGLDLPDTPDPDSPRSRRPARPSSLPFAPRTHIGHMKQLIGQLYKVIDDCGLVCGLHSFRAALDSRSIQADALQNKSRRWSSETSPAHLNQQQSRVICTETNVSMKKEILSDVFDPRELWDGEAVVHSSMLEVMGCLAAAMGPQRCSAAAKTLRSNMSRSKPVEQEVTGVECAASDPLPAPVPASPTLTGQKRKGGPDPIESTLKVEEEDSRVAYGALLILLESIGSGSKTRVRPSILALPAITVTFVCALPRFVSGP